MEKLHSPFKVHDIRIVDGVTYIAIKTSDKLSCNKCVARFSGRLCADITEANLFRCGDLCFKKLEGGL